MVESVRAIIRFDATANIRMAAEVLEREWREIGETATGDKTSNTVCIEALRGLELLGSSGRRKVMYGASSTMPREGQKGSVDHVVFRTHSKVWHLCGQRPRISQPAILAFHIKVARHRNYVSGLDGDYHLGPGVAQREWVTPFARNSDHQERQKIMNPRGSCLGWG